jgi:multidrug efflux pump
VCVHRGITGQFFRQFALTIAVSTLISAFNSLTLSPALTALLLKPSGEAEESPPLPQLAFPVAGAWLAYEFGAPRIEAFLPDGWPEWLPIALAAAVGVAAGWLASRPLNALLAAVFGAFNRGFGHVTGAYTRGVGLLLRGSVIVLVVYGGLLGLTYFSFVSTPKGFIPQQDMGYLLVSVQLPDSAAKERTDAVLRQLEDILLSTPGVRHATSISGQSFALSAFGSNFGSMFINLKDYADRLDPGLSGEAIANRLRGEFAKIPEANLAIFAPPPVRGVGRAGGFTFVVEDRGGSLGPVALQEQVENLVRKGNQTQGLTGLFSVFRANVPQLKVTPDERQCLTRGVSIKDFADTLRIYEGSLYVNDFNLFDRTWQVVVQADSPFRDEPEDLRRLKVRNARGQMVPFGSLADIREVNGPLVLPRYNMYPAALINGNAAPGFSSRQAIELMEQLADQELPKTMKFEWTDMSYLELLAGNTALALFGLAVVMVFLVLAAQYESWSLPLAVILVVPMCLLSAIIGVNVARMDINIFTQIGFVVLVGLASKNAILIVEFAKAQRAAGVDRRQAALEACKLRLRPIVMTSLAFVLGVLPLILSHGAGAEMRKALGTAVFSGMLGVTIFGLAFTPVFFFTVDRLGAARLFAGSVASRAGDRVLDWISLGPARRAGVKLWQQQANGIRRERPVQPTEKK